jgi:hypothetical protein
MSRERLHLNMNSMEIWGPIYHCELQEENIRAYVPNLYIEKMSTETRPIIEKMSPETRPIIEKMSTETRPITY